MDPLQGLRAKIPDFPGYGDELARRHSDELVRSYLGEALVELSTRLAPLESDRRTQIDALLLRVGFADQQAFARHGCGPDEGGRGPECDAVLADDVETVELADRAAAIDPPALPAYLSAVERVLERRDATLRAAAAS
jgi:hypothetical protein